MKLKILSLISFLLFSLTTNLFGWCSIPGQRYAEIKVGENLLDLTHAQFGVYDNPKFVGDPQFAIIGSLGIFSANELQEPIKNFELTKKVNEEVDNLYKKFGEVEAFKKRTAGLTVAVLSEVKIRQCSIPFLKVEEMIQGGYRIKYKGKDYFIPEYYHYFYLDETLERKWVEKLKKDKSFVEVFEKIKSALLSKSIEKLRALMLPEAEDGIKELYEKYKIKPFYYEFFFDYACNPFNLGIVRLPSDKEIDCNTLRIEFPLVTYRPFASSESRVQGEVVFIRFTSTQESRTTAPTPPGTNPVDVKKIVISTFNRDGDQGFVLVRQGSTWKIKDIYIDNNRSSGSVQSHMPSYWSRIQQYEREEEEFPTLYKEHGHVGSSRWTPFKITYADLEKAKAEGLLIEPTSLYEPKKTTPTVEPEKGKK